MILRKRLIGLGILAGALVLLTAGVVFATVVRSSSLELPISERTESTQFELKPVLSGLAQPTFVTHAGDGSGRLFIVEQAGLVRILDEGNPLDKPFLDIRPITASNNWEQGLLSIAFHPQYATNGRFFAYYVSAQDGGSVVAEYEVSENPNLALPEGKLILEVPNGSGLEAGVHYGGQLQFGPDGFLYISIGDGYKRPEVTPGTVKPSQSLSNLAGSILRIDVDQETPYSVPADNPFVNNQDARPEIWAYGLRNPWRFSFDRETGDLYLGDVGFVSAEEINRVVKGANYGWPVKEGATCYVQSWQGRSGCYLRAVRDSFHNPIAHYNRFQNEKFVEGRTSGVSGGNSVTGGYVYRGEQYPSLEGYLFAADFIFGNVWSLKEVGERTWEVGDSLKTNYLISSFGEDESGELYALDWASGTLLQVIAPAN